MATHKEDTNLTKAIERLDMGRGKSFNNLFDDFLDFALSFHCGNPNDTQVRLFDEAKGKPELWSLYMDAVKCYEAASEDYHDPLGDTFMERISHGSHGQFFTPQNVCELMSEILVDDAEGSIYDCACGSGRLLLAGLKKARERGENPAIIAGDISYTCCRMVLLNLLTQCAHGEVQQGDSLMLKFDEFVFYKMETVAIIGSGICLSQYWQYSMHTFDEVRRKREEWYRDMACYGVIPYDMGKERKASEPEPMKAEPQRLAAGQQLTLF